jgi:hypothetical protein
VLTLKAVEVAPAVTATDVGTVSLELEFESETVAPPVGAPWERATVQLLDELGPKLVGLHDSDDTDPDKAKLTFVVADVPP